MAGKLIYLIYKVTHTAALNYRGYTDPSLMLVPNGGDKQRRQRGKKGEMKEGMGRRGEREKEVHKERGKEVFLWRPLSCLLLPHLNLRLALPRTYCGAAGHCGALTFVNMSYCLPTWQTSFPVSIHSLGSPKRDH